MPTDTSSRFKATLPKNLSFYRMSKECCLQEGGVYIILFPSRECYVAFEKIRSRLKFKVDQITKRLKSDSLSGKECTRGWLDRQMYSYCRHRWQGWFVRRRASTYISQCQFSSESQGLPSATWFPIPLSTTWWLF